jgi:hypothetical protein
MGNSGSMLAVLRNAYGPKSGGNDGMAALVLGGFEGTASYGGSVMSSTNRKLIKDIARCFASDLGLPGLKPGSKTLDEIITGLKKYVPDPRGGKGNGSTFSPKKDVQIRSCKALGRCINKAMGSKMVDLDAPAGEICDQVSEMMYTLFTDIQSEFVGVRDDVKRIIKNLKVVNKFMDMNYKALLKKIAAKSKTGSLAATETAILRQAHKDINSESKRQLKLLENVLSVSVAPADKKLEALLKDARDFKQLVRKLKMVPGTAKFGEKFSYVLSGVRSVAQAAKLVDEALKKVGLSYNEYKATKGVKAMQTKLNKLLKKKLDKGTSADLRAHLKGAKILYSREYMKDKILDELKKKGRGDNIVLEGGNVQGGLKVAKSVKQRQELKKGLLVAFNRRLADIFEQIMVSTQAVAEQVGAGKISLTEDLRKFVQAIDALPDIGQRYTYYALSGFRDDIQSREEREKYLSSARNVMATADKLKGASGHFGDLNKAFGKAVDLIQTFSKKFAEGLGSVDPYTKRQAKKADGADEHEGGAGGPMTQIKKATGVKKGFMKTIVGFFKGKDEAIEGAGSYPEINRLAYTMDKAKESILYYFRAAKIRQNLAKASTELKDYSSDYVKIRSDAIAEGIDKTLQDKKDFMILLTEKSKSPIGPTGRMFWEIKSTVAGGNMETAKKIANRLKEFYNDRCDAKVQMYKTAEAMDEYMRAFTDGIVSNPDDLRALSKMLDQVEVISKWYTTKAGDLVCQVFDSFKDAAGGTVPKINDNYDKGGVKDEHYYIKVLAACRLGAAGGIIGNDDARTGATDVAGDDDLSRRSNPGHPFAGKISIVEADGKSNAKDVLKKLEDSLCEVMVLKNLVSAFVAIGDRFGGKELKNKTHMSPIQIYKNLTNYMKVAALDMGKPVTTSEWPEEIPDLEMSRTLLAEWIVVVGTDLNNGLAVGNAYNALITANTNPQIQYNGENAPVNYIAFIGELNVPDQAVKIIDFHNNATLDKVLIKNIEGNNLITALSNAINVDIRALSIRNKLFKVLEKGGPGQTEIIRDLQRQIHGTQGFKGEISHQFKDVNHLYMRGIEGSAGAGNNYFEITDKLFVLTIKAMIAKIMTVLGVYNMFKKPINKHGLGYQSHLRLTIGGDDAIPKVMPEAIELYTRLPLLAEFYRQIFDFEGDKNDKSINMIPEMDGTFSGLIELIFDRAKHVKNGAYSDTEIRFMIQEINKIYSRFRGSKDPTMEAIHAFIAEVNRRYGIVKKAEKVEYLKEKRERYRTKYQTGEDTIDFELSTMDESDTYPRPSPSDAFVTVSGETTLQDHKHRVDFGHRDLLRGLRTKINKIFKKAEDRVREDLNYNKAGKAQNALRMTSFSNLLEARREELRQAKSDKERYDIVTSTINGFNQFAMTAQSRPMIAFHETVITGLNTLHGLYKLLKGFHDGVNEMFWTVKGTEVFSKSSTTTANAGNMGNYVIDPDYLQGQINNGTQGATQDVDNLGNILDRINLAADADKKRGQSALWRFALDQDNILKTVFELLYGHATDMGKLVDMKLDSQGVMKVHLDHSKLKEVIINTFNQVKQTLDKFRGLLPKNIIDKYEKFGDKPENVGSLYWIEQKLIDELLNGKHYHKTTTPSPPTDIPTFFSTGAAVEKYKGDMWFPEDNLDREATKLNYVMEYLSRDWKFDAAGLQAGIPAVKDNSPDTTKHQFGTILNEMISFKPAARVGAANSIGVAVDLGAAIAGESRGIEKLLYNTSGKTYLNRQADSLWDPKYQRRVRGLYDPTVQWTDDNNRGVFVMFNRLVGRYTQQVYDDTNERIYINTLNSFANGSFNNAVMGNDNFDDTRDTDEHVETDNVGTKVLSSSLARMIKQLMTEKTSRLDKLRFLESDLSEIPLYMKERFKANLPVFKKLFEYLRKRCDMLTMFVKGFNVYHPALAGGAVPLQNNANYSPKLTTTLDKINQGSTSLIRCITDTMDELADDPKYFELRIDFIQEYQTRYGKSPFMPYSSMLTLFKSQPNLAEDISLPINQMGSNAMKFLYGVRGVLCKHDVSFSQLVGPKQIIEAHNDTVDQRFKIDTKEAERFYQNATTILRYVVDAKKYRSLFTFKDNGNLLGHVGTELLTTGDPRVPTDGIHRSGGEIYVFPLGNAKVELSELIGLTESSFQKEQMMKFVKAVEAKTDLPSMDGADRDTIIAFNLIDLNVVPINVHALMREMPLVNLYNYEWTFDNFVKDILKTDSKVMDLVPNTNNYQPANQLGNESGKAVLASTLIHPYGTMTQNHRDNLSNIVRGALGVDTLGRPLFLGDELWNKSLFNELYTQNRSEMGPALQTGPADLNVLKYLKTDDKTLKGDIVSITFNANVAVGLTGLGNVRLDTKFMRNLFWLTNLHRILRLKMRRDLLYYNSKIVNNKRVIAPGITELYDNDMYSQSTDPYRY